MVVFIRFSLSASKHIILSNVLKQLFFFFIFLSPTVIYIYIYIYIERERVLKCTPMAPQTWIESQVESYQRLKLWYLMPPGLTFSIVRYGSRIKWSNPGKGVTPSPTPWFRSYRKGGLRVTLDYGRQLYFFLYILSSTDRLFRWITTLQCG